MRFNDDFVEIIKCFLNSLYIYTIQYMNELNNNQLIVFESVKMSNITEIIKIQKYILYIYALFDLFKDQVLIVG